MGDTLMRALETIKRESSGLLGTAGLLVWLQVVEASGLLGTRRCY